MSKPIGFIRWFGNSPLNLEENARLAAEAALKATQEAAPPPRSEDDMDKTTYTENADYDTTFATTANTTTMSTTTTTTKPPAKTKKKVKPKLSAKEKKERSVSMLQILRQLAVTSDKMTIEKLISCLPLEFRGSDAVCVSGYAFEKECLHSP